MKQIVQNARTGGLEILEVPAPSPGPGQVLVRNHFSVVSTGTETQSLEFARMSIFGKARSRPDLTRQVMRKLREEGPLPTYRTVMNRLGAPQALGYSSAGVVEEVGAEVVHFSPGDRVACAGAGYASHAEFAVVPENLVARVPETVAMEQAAFATIGAIALQGVRVANPAIGELCAVIGLGLIGQMTVQLLRANGCRILGIDLDAERVKQGLELGAEWGATPDALSASWRDVVAQGYGADFAMVTASATTAAPLALAAELSRPRGRVVMVGAMPMELDRRTFYDKELQLLMSMSYGPGRYDRRYEELGLDYPLPYVRWTENRNLQAFLALVASGSVKPELLRPKIRPFSEALDTYEELSKGGGEVAALFRYDVRAARSRTIDLEPPAPRARKEEVGVAFIGAGNYAKSVLLPALPKEGVRRGIVVTATGPSALRTAERHGFGRCGTDPSDAIRDPAVDLVFIATRHDTHTALAVEALRAHKAVWLEKPVSLTLDDLDVLVQAALDTEGFLTVGYNRRFSPHARAIREAVAGRNGPMAIHYVVAAGAPPRGSWVLDPREGGGRVVGEVCHFVDLCGYLVGHPPASVYAQALARDPETDDSVAVMIGYGDGSTAVIEYLSHTSAHIPKERFEVSADGCTAACNNFRTTEISGSSPIRTLNQDK
ncbi:MAG TPA: bi-domain-containing oxidoreductase, partial [Longimicrobiales bacterium]|nr:bi-domain-containing oxidoreductase [Longimicrobiales bacterium]